MQMCLKMGGLASVCLFASQVSLGQESNIEAGRNDVGNGAGDFFREYSAGTETSTVNTGAATTTGNVNSVGSEHEVQPLPGSQNSAVDGTQKKALPGDDKPVSGHTESGYTGALLDSLVRHSSSSQLNGSPLALGHALAGATTRAMQSQRVELYWELSTAVMQYHLALRELSELSALQQSILQPEPAWDDVRETFHANSQTKLQAARALQYRLLNEMGGAADAALPLPSDLPLCGAYQTRYEDFFGGEYVPEAAALDQLIKGEYSSLRWQAGSVASARQWLDAVSRQRSSQSDGSDLLQAYNSFASARRLFLHGLNQYNNHIVRYTELATPRRVGTQRLVAMLIKTDSLKWKREGIRRTSAEQQVDDSNTSREQIRTYADPNETDARNSAKPEFHQERSILIK